MKLGIGPLVAACPLRASIADPYDFAYLCNQSLPVDERQAFEEDMELLPAP